MQSGVRLELWLLTPRRLNIVSDVCTCSGVGTSPPPPYTTPPAEKYSRVLETFHRNCSTVRAVVVVVVAVVPVVDALAFLFALDRVLLFFAAYG